MYNTKYVASRSIGYATDFHNEKISTGDQAICFTINKSGTVYVTTNALENFANLEILHPIILFSGDSDTPVVDKMVILKIIGNPNVKHWFAQNLLTDINSDKLSHLPIGLDYHTLHGHIGMRHPWGDGKLPADQEHDLHSIPTIPFGLRVPMAYSNFHFYSDRGDRVDAIKKIPRAAIYYEEDYLPRNISWKKMGLFKFVACPEGCGADCHRTWEALILGCVPVVKRSRLDPLFEGLPVLFVNDWSELTLERMNSFVYKMEKPEKLTLKYWMDLGKAKLESNSIWCPNDKRDFSGSQLGQLNETSIRGKVITDILKGIDCDNIVEIGTWNGLGSTKCILNGLKGKPYNGFWSLECNKEKNEIAKNNLREFLMDKDHIIHGTILEESDFNIDLYTQFFPELSQNSEFMRWHKVDIDNARISPNVLSQLPNSIDFLLLDGGEFTTHFEYLKLKNRVTKILCMDDVNVSKCYRIRHELLHSSNWKEVFYTDEGNGFSIFARIC